MERRFSVHARSHRQALTVVASLVLAASVTRGAYAAPKDADAKKMFDKGVAAYTKGDYAGAAASLSESYAREGDPETLFAWAQAERKLGHCSNAVELYNTLLAFDLPAENKKVIETQLAECKQILGAEKKPDKKPDKVAAHEEPTKEETPPPEPRREEPPPHEEAAPPPRAESPKPEGRSWWKDPVGGGLVIGGVVAIGFGTVMMVSASSADSAKNTEKSYSAFKQDINTAHDDGMYGVIGLVVGGAAVAGGIAWYATHKDQDHATVTGWVAPSGGGVAISGRY